MERASHALRRPSIVRRALAVVGAASLIGAVAAVATIGTAHAADNLVANPGFEDGLSGWTCSGGSGTAVSSPVHGGSKALQGTPTGQDNAQCSQVVSVRPNSAYTLTAWVQGSYVYLGASGTGTADVSNWTPSASSYQQLSTNFSTGPNTTSVTVWTHGWYAQPVYHADDIALSGPGGTPTPTPTPTTPPPTTTPPPPTSAPPTTPPPTTTPPSGGALPKHTLTGYWQNFDNGATVQTLAQVPSRYDIIAVAFADATTTPGAVTFNLDTKGLGGYTVPQFTADIAAKRAAGTKVVISIGGQNGTVSVRDGTSATNFADSVYSLMRTYGFDGVDIDLENGLDSTYMTQALRSLSVKAGPGLVITMAPQTIDMQSTSGEYFKTALNVKDILTVVTMQYYNSGSMLGCDGKVYTQGTVDFLTALACIQLQGGLDPSQVGLGLPASARGAGSGYVSPSVVDNALDCLTQGTGCGSFTPPKTYPTLRGAMTWSTNWDAANGNDFSTTVGTHLHALP